MLPAQVRFARSGLRGGGGGKGVLWRPRRRFSRGRAATAAAHPTSPAPLCAAHGSVWAWGTTDDGQLGTPARAATRAISLKGMSNQEPTPLRVEALEGRGVRSIAFGARHAACATGDGRVMTWGRPDHGVLGHKGSSTAAGGDLVPLPGLVDSDFGGEKVVQVACGDFHTAALTEKGHVWTWGWGGSFLSGSGALGHGDSEAHAAPKLVLALKEEGVKVAQISAGGVHMAARTAGGNLWMWGSGEYGRLGTGGSGDESEPVVVDWFADEKIKLAQVACGHAFTLALTVDGVVFAWGRNDQGQCGTEEDLSDGYHNM